MASKVLIQERFPGYCELFIGERLKPKTLIENKSQKESNTCTESEDSFCSLETLTKHSPHITVTVTVYCH